MLVYSAVTEFPSRRRFLLAAEVPLEATPLETVLKQETQRQVDCAGAARDQRPCILKSFLP